MNVHSITKLRGIFSTSALRSHLSQPDDVQLHLRRPLLVRRLNVTETVRRATATTLAVRQPPAAAADSDCWPRMRLVHHQWRDLAEFPCFTERLHDVRTSSGRDVTLPVRLRAFPDCEVRWYKDGRPLARHRPAHVSVLQYSRTLFVLHIRQAQPADAGVYSCSAHNCAGAVRTSGYVHVEPYSGPYLPVRLNKWM